MNNNMISYEIQYIMQKKNPLNMNVYTPLNTSTNFK